jgi:putative FmdB family regulatory protein
MPIYEYECTACGHQLEALQKMSEDPLKDCPKCNQPTLNKLVSAAGFQLKGSGWYVTDYSNKGKSKQQAEKSDSTPAATENKPAESAPAAASAETKTTGSSSNDSGAASA